MWACASALLHSGGILASGLTIQSDLSRLKNRFLHGPSVPKRSAATVIVGKGTERYEVFATKGLPRMMVREDFPNGTSSELAAIK